MQSLDKHSYSVPHIHRGKEVHVRVRARTVEVLLNGNCIATHVRSRVPYGYTTLPEHMPSAHQATMENSSAAHVLQRAAKVGLNAQRFCTELMSRREHPEQAIKAILGVLGLCRVWPVARVDAACARALRFKMFKGSSIKNILRSGLDQQSAEPPAQAELPWHLNIRGGSYFMH